MEYYSALKKNEVLRYGLSLSHIGKLSTTMAGLGSGVEPLRDKDREILICAPATVMPSILKPSQQPAGATDMSLSLQNYEPNKLLFLKK